MLTKLKKQIQQILSSQARIAYNLGVTPNVITTIGLCLSISSAVAYALATNWSCLLLLAPALLLSSGFCDALDGIVARNHRQATAFGGFFDSIIDRYADALVFSGIVVGGLCNVYWGLAALIGSMLVSYSRARSEAAGVKMESVGIAERAERMLILVGTSIAAFFWLPLMNLGIAILAILSNATVLQRGIYAYKAMKEKQGNS